ncbi:hypothetical protein [Streptomyces sp. NPDC057287]|uniref:hypothetical protein n=1 Tax=Streptomyces sp. NPDC057287 TaxID=3346086 RepID=UPI00362A7F6A
MRGSVDELGGALGMAVLGAAVYSRDMADALPAGTPHADAVRETLGGAAAVAADLPAATADAVVMAARDAFTAGWASRRSGRPWSWPERTATVPY